VRLDEGQFDALGAKSSCSTGSRTRQNTSQAAGLAKACPFYQTRPQEAGHPVDVA